MGYKNYKKNKKGNIDENNIMIGKRNRITSTEGVWSLITSNKIKGVFFSKNEEKELFPKKKKDNKKITQNNEKKIDSKYFEKNKDIFSPFENKISKNSKKISKNKENDEDINKRPIGIKSSFKPIQNKEKRIIIGEKNKWVAKKIKNFITNKNENDSSLKVLQKHIGNINNEISYPHIEERKFPIIIKIEDH